MRIWYIYLFSRVVSDKDDEKSLVISMNGRCVLALDYINAIMENQFVLILVVMLYLWSGKKTRR